MAVSDEVWEVADNRVGFEAIDGGFLCGLLVFGVKIEERGEEKDDKE